MTDERKLWALTDHVCRTCFGRVLERTNGSDEMPANVHLYRCSNCGLEAWHSTRRPSVLCACGLKLKNGADAGIRCERNAEPTPEFPSEVVASQVSA